MKKLQAYFIKNWKVITGAIVLLVVIYVAYRQFFGTPVGSDALDTTPSTGSTTKKKVSVPLPSPCITIYNNKPGAFPLKQGSKGSNVKQLQRFIGATCADGDWGPKTQALFVAKGIKKVPFNSILTTEIDEQTFKFYGIDKL